MFQDNKRQHRFEWAESGQIAFADYHGPADRLAIAHVESPIALRGTGAADRLMRAIVIHARDEGLKLVPRCSYAVAWFARHGDEADVLA